MPLIIIKVIRVFKLLKIIFLSISNVKSQFINPDRYKNSTTRLLLPEILGSY